MGRPVIAFAFAFMGLTAIGVYIATLTQTLYSLALAAVALLVITIGVYLLNIFAKQHREKLENTFSSQRDERGVVGYQPTDEVITDPEAIQKKSVSVGQSSGITAAIGLLLIIGGAYWTYDVKTLIDKAIRTNGTIVSQVSERNSEGQTMYRAVVQFRPYRQEAVQFKDSTSSSHPSWKVGDKVQVYYDPDNVDDAMVDGGLFNYLVQSIMLLVGAMLLLLSLWQYRQKSKSANT